MLKYTIIPFAIFQCYTQNCEDNTTYNNKSKNLVPYHFWLVDCNFRCSPFRKKKFSVDVYMFISV